MPDNPDLFRVSDDKDAKVGNSGALRRWVVDITVAVVVMVVVYVIACWLLTPADGAAWTYDEFLRRL